MTSREDYDAIRRGAALGAVDPRRQLAVAGADRLSYLQGLLTNDIQSLAPASGCYAAWLSPQGRMLTDMHVLESGAMVLLDVPAATAAQTLARLDQFLFTEDVRLESLEETLTGRWIHGPSAPAVLESVLGSHEGLAAWPQYRHSPVPFGGGTVVVARIDQLGVPGFCTYVEPGRADALTSALRDAGAREVLAEAIEAARIEEGYPVYGVDMTADTIPLEAGIEDRAISFTKGCYVGQEIIIRVVHRGHGRVAKKLVGLRLETAPAAAGDRIFAGEREVGFVTSGAESPRFGSIALAYVHRDFVAPGTAMLVEHQGERTPATVTSRPIAPAA